MPNDKIPPANTNSNIRSRSPSPASGKSPVKPKKQKTAAVSENPFLHELEDQKNFEAFRQYFIDKLLSHLHDFGIEKCTLDDNQILILPNGLLQATIDKDVKAGQLPVNLGLYLQKIMKEKFLKDFECDLDLDAVISCFNPKYQPHKDGPKKSDRKEWTLTVPLFNYDPINKTIDTNIEATQILRDDQYKENPDNQKGYPSTYDMHEFKKYMYERFISDKGIASLFPRSTHKDTPQRRNSAAHASPPPSDGEVRILLILILTEKEDHPKK